MCEESLELSTNHFSPPRIRQLRLWWERGIVLCLPVSLSHLFDPTPSSLIPPAMVRAPKIAHHFATGPKAKSQCAKSSRKKKKGS